MAAMSFWWSLRRTGKETGTETDTETGRLAGVQSLCLKKNKGQERVKKHKQ